MPSVPVGEGGTYEIPRVINATTYS